MAARGRWRLLVADTGKPAPEAAIRFYAAAGFSAEALQDYREPFGFFGRLVSELPESCVRIHENDWLALGEHTWRVLMGRGHSPEHACLYCKDRNLLISGDQVLPTISANGRKHRNTRSGPRAGICEIRRGSDLSLLAVFLLMWNYGIGSMNYPARARLT